VTSDDQREPPRPATNRVLIAATCMTYGGAINFTNVAISKINGEIELDPHVIRACVLRLTGTALLGYATP
jgi:hypothetical protein